MDEFIAYIDETGGFSFTDKPRNCYVGGWVCQKNEGSEAVLKKLLLSEVHKFNTESESDVDLVYPDDMHFIPLHTPAAQRNDSDRHIAVKPECIPPFFQSLFNVLRPRVKFCFFSQGLPAFIFHEQYAYFEVLRNTLAQLLNDKRLGRASSLKIVIASRRKEVLYGFAGFENRQKFESYLAQKLTLELQSLLSPGQMTLTISFASARKNPGLMLADFFCGDRKSRKDYSSGASQQIYKFIEGFRFIDTEENVLKSSADLNLSAAFINTAQIYAGSRKRELQAELKKLYSGITSDEDEKKQFCRMVASRLQHLLVDSAERYLNLDEAEVLIRVCRECLPASEDALDNDELSLTAALNLAEIKIRSHRGSINTGLIGDHINFLKQHHQKIFARRLDYLQHLVDAVLIGVQVNCFNQLDFTAIEEYIEPVSDVYKAVMAACPVTDGPDENSAKLLGTVGQMHGFLYALNQNEHSFLTAETALKGDVAACLPGSKDWEQGMGYLTTLYWYKGDLDRAVASFLEESRSTDHPQEQVFNLHEDELFGGFRKPFLLLHRLYLGALAQRRGGKLAGIAEFHGQIMKNLDLTAYPNTLSAKWLAVMLMNAGEYEAAGKLLNNALGKADAGDFTIDFVRLPLKILRHQALIKLGRSSSFSLADELARLEKSRPGLNALLAGSGWQDCHQYRDDWDSYKIAQLPPFYYA